MAASGTLPAEPTASVARRQSRHWPQSVNEDGEFVEFDYERRVQSQQVDAARARGKAFLLAGGFQLLVARDVDERDLTQGCSPRRCPGAWLMLLFGLVGGALMSRNVLARLDRSIAPAPRSWPAISRAACR